MLEPASSRVVVITGAFGALGSAVARAFAANGARLALVDVAQQPSARPDGLGAEFAAGLTKTIWLSAAIIPILLIALGLPRSILATIAAALVTLGIIRTARSRLGGITGDVLGMTIEVVEAVVVLVFCATA